MSFPKIEDARSLSDSELSEQIIAVKRQMFELRMKKATRRLEELHQFKHCRHQLAQLMTVERERQLIGKNRPEGAGISSGMEEDRP